MAFETPILFITFNRPAHTSKVFERIREVKPKFLFVASDGPRPNHPEDPEKIMRVRELISTGIDWDCELKTLFRQENLGCGYGPANAISWFFSHVEEGIILEDDCYPSLSFFTFCKECLNAYKDNHSIYNIAGSNFQCGIVRTAYSYYFSKYAFTWGWATWKRAWDRYNIQIPKEEISRTLKEISFSKKEVKYWSHILTLTADNKFDAWDYSWYYLIWKNKGLCIVPARNLIKNIGIGNESTHTSSFSDKYELCALEEIKNFVPNQNFTIDSEADSFYCRNFLYSRTSFPNILRNIAYKVIPPRMYSRLKKLKDWFK